MVDSIIKYWPYLATIVAILTFLMGYLYSNQIKGILDLRYSDYSTNNKMLKSKRREILKTLIVYSISVVFTSLTLVILTSPKMIWILTNTILSLKYVDYSITFFAISYFLILVLFFISLILEIKMFKQYYKFRR